MSARTARRATVRDGEAFLEEMDRQDFTSSAASRVTARYARGPSNVSGIRELSYGSEI
jgi:hypothetical protein